MADKILIIEDDPELAQFLSDGLSAENYLTTISYTGSDGLKKIREKDIDLVLLDLSLPDIDGLQLCRIIRESLSMMELPIIMLTARTTPEDKVAGLDAGADDYITKPFSFRELKTRIQTTLKRAKMYQREVTVSKGITTVEMGGPELIEETIETKKISQRISKWNDPFFRYIIGSLMFSSVLLIWSRLTFDNELGNILLISGLVAFVFPLCGTILKSTKDKILQKILLSIEQRIKLKEYDKAKNLYKKYKLGGGELTVIPTPLLLELFEKTGSLPELIGEEISTTDLHYLIREAINSGKYEIAYYMYERYKSEGGALSAFSREEIFKLFSEMSLVDKLSSESFSLEWFLYFSKRLREGGEAKKALNLIRKLNLLDELPPIDIDSLEYKEMVDLQKLDPYREFFYAYEANGMLDELVDALNNSSLEIVCYSNFAKIFAEKGKRKQSLVILRETLRKFSPQMSSGERKVMIGLYKKISEEK